MDKFEELNELVDATANLNDERGFSFETAPRAHTGSTYEANGPAQPASLEHEHGLLNANGHTGTLIPKVPPISSQMTQSGYGTYDYGSSTARLAPNHPWKNSSSATSPPNEGGIFISFDYDDFTFVMRQDGLYAKKTDSKQDVKKICSPFSLFSAMNMQGTPFAVVLRPHQANPIWLVLETADIHTEMNKCVRLLSEHGVWISNRVSAKKMLASYLLSRSEKILEPVLVTGDPGWVSHNGEHSFVRHSGVSSSGQPPWYAKDGVVSEFLPEPNPIKGSLEDWKNNIGTLCECNLNLVFAVSAVLSSVLLSPFNLKGVGIHFYGPSSLGKTTLLHVASSIVPWEDGDSILSWRSTDNGLEEVCRQHNDFPLLLDELGEIEPKALAKAIYMISNGQGKRRFGKNHKETVQWKTLYLSSGEIPSKTHLETSGIQHTTGHLVRLLDIPAAVENGYGVFHAVPSGFSPQTLSHYLKDAAQQYHGVVMMRFLDILTGAYSHSVDCLRNLAGQFKADVITTLDAPSERVCEYFALAAAAGELAISNNLLPWRTGHAMDAAHYAYRMWLDNYRGASKPLRVQVMDRLYSVLEHYGESKFLPYQGANSLGDLGGAYGYRIMRQQSTEFIILDESFVKIFKGFEPRIVCEILSDARILQREDRNFKIKRAIPGNPNARCYVLHIPMH